MTAKIRRLRKAKGRYMKLTNPTLMREYMELRDFSQARLGRYAGCSRQFIHQLLNGDVKTCTPEIASLIEEALSLLPGTLFMDPKSPVGRNRVNRKTKTAA